MDMIGENPRLTANDLQNKYGLSPRWARFYSQEADFFLNLRKLRNDIEHGGLTPEVIFATHKGFAVEAESKIFLAFGKGIWKEETFLPNKLAPLKPVLAHIIGSTLRSMHNFAEAITQEIGFAEELAPGYRVFMRGHYINRLAKLNDYMQTDVWYPETSAPTPK